MKKWRFVSNQNSTIVGINDAGIEICILGH